MQQKEFREMLRPDHSFVLSKKKGFLFLKPKRSKIRMLQDDKKTMKQPHQIRFRGRAGETVSRCVGGSRTIAYDMNESFDNLSPHHCFCRAPRVHISLASYAGH